MGAAAFKLGDLALARSAFGRAAQLDPGCADALLGLALVHFSSPNVQQVREEGGWAGHEALLALGARRASHCMTPC